jgi:multidrug efflux pump
VLKPWGDRKKTDRGLAAELNKELSARSPAFAPSPRARRLQRGGGGGGGGGGSNVDLIAAGNDYAQIGAG